MILLFSLFIISVYCLLIIRWNSAWNKTALFNFSETNATINLSVVIPVRNEEANIRQVLTSLLNQHYPKHLYEIIVSDDHSSDKTIRVVKDFLSEHPAINGIVIEAKTTDSLSKKEALKRAIEIAKGELIVTTDADCIHPNEWLQTIASYFILHQPVMICGPVLMKGDQSLLQQFQTLDYMSLQVSGAASLALNKLLLCSGANLAFSRKAFYDVDGYDDNLNIASGDDTFLMLKLNKKFPGRIHFLKSKASIVTTPASLTLVEFLQQRSRWVSKTKYYQSAYIKALGGFIFLVNIFPLVLLTITFCDPMQFYILFIYLLLKAIADYSFLSNASRFFNISINKIKFGAWEIIYPFYMLALLSGFLRGSYHWKHRRHHS